MMGKERQRGISKAKEKKENRKKETGKWRGK